MPLKIIRNDIVNMNTDAVVNTANKNTIVGPGCDKAIYNAAGYDELLKFRIENVGFVPEGHVFITPGFNLKAKFIIHAVAPLYIDGNHDEEKKLRACYKNSLALAKKNNIKSIAFPLISTGGFGYPKAEGLRVAVDEINYFLLDNEMLIYIVVFDEKAKELSEKIYPDLEEYIDRNYVQEKKHEEYQEFYSFDEEFEPEKLEKLESKEKPKRIDGLIEFSYAPKVKKSKQSLRRAPRFFEEELDLEKLNSRMKHLSDTFSQYLMYLIKNKNLKNSDVYKNAIIDKRIFSRIKNNINYHPDKKTALCLCIGAKLNLDETKDLLARAGYALSPCDKTDIIFSYFIENEIYDMIELDIQLEEHGLQCIIS